MRRVTLVIAAALAAAAALGPVPALAGCGPDNPNCIVPTAPAGANDNRAASTAFVQAALGAFSPTLSIGATPVSGAAAGDALYSDGSHLQAYAVSGNTAVLATVGGSLTNGHSLIATSGNVTDAGGVAPIFAAVAVGDLIYASQTTPIAFSRLADVATGSVLASGGIGVAPAWSALGAGVLGALSSAANATGGFPTVPVGVAQGGTGQSALTANAFLTGNGTGAVNPVALTGLVLGNGASAPTAYAGASCTNEVLTALSASGAPTCSSITNAFLSAGSFTSITGVGTLTAGTWNANTIAVGYGGTGQTSVTAGALVTGNGASPLSSVADVATGALLASGGAAANPSYCTACTLSASLTVPALYGGAAAASSLTLQSTSAASPAGDLLAFKASSHEFETAGGSDLFDYGVTAAATWTLLKPTVVSGASFGLAGNISAPAWTTNGVRYKNAAATLTDTTSSGTVAAAYSDVWGGSTIAASSAVTFTNYFGSYFKVPAAGTNVTLGAAWALGADSLKVGTSNQLTVSANGALGVNAPETLTAATTVASASGATLDDLAVAAATTTITGTTGITQLNKVAIYQPTFTDASAVTISKGATLYIAGSPLTGGSVTLTNGYALLVGTGIVQVGTGSTTAGSNQLFISGNSGSFSYASRLELDDNLNSNSRNWAFFNGASAAGNLDLRASTSNGGTTAAGATEIMTITPAGAMTIASATLTGAAPTVAANQIGYGGTTAAATSCGSLASAAGCVVINVGGTTHYVPYY